MLLHQQIQDNMLEEEVVSFGRRAQQEDQQQLQLRQHNIPHNPVYLKQVMSPNRQNVEAPIRVGHWLRSILPAEQFVTVDCSRRLLDTVGQVRNFEQSLLRAMKGLSRACEFYTKLLLNGVYEFLERTGLY